MALFEFNLKPLGEISPWGEKPNLHLDWFGLTDSTYYMNVGNEKLFQYSEEILEYWSKESSYCVSYKNPYYDYQVSRLYEDLLDILPNILQAIPQTLYGYISTIEKQKNWEQSLSEIVDSYESVDAIEELNFFDTYDDATQWLYCRKLIGLGGGPDILIYRVDERIFIRWDNSDYKQNNINIWSASSGEFELTVEEFLSEVNLFHNKLMKDMEERISFIFSNNPLPNVLFNEEELIAEQEERILVFERSFSEKAATNDWNDVLNAYKILESKGSDSMPVS